jgi:hypothetical protein
VLAVGEHHHHAVWIREAALVGLVLGRYASQRQLEANACSPHRRTIDAVVRTDHAERDGAPDELGHRREAILGLLRHEKLEHLLGAREIRCSRGAVSMSLGPSALELRDPVVDGADRGGLLLAERQVGLRGDFAHRDVDALARELAGLHRRDDLVAEQRLGREDQRCTRLLGSGHLDERDLRSPPPRTHDGEFVVTRAAVVAHPAGEPRPGNTRPAAPPLTASQRVTVPAPGACIGGEYAIEQTGVDKSIEHADEHAAGSRTTATVLVRLRRFPQLEPRDLETKRDRVRLRHREIRVDAQQRCAVRQLIPRLGGLPRIGELHLRSGNTS